jgi:hypothetical protein
VTKRQIEALDFIAKHRGGVCWLPTWIGASTRKKLIAAGLVEEVNPAGGVGMVTYRATDEARAILKA